MGNGAAMEPEGSTPVPRPTAFTAFTNWVSASPLPAVAAGQTTLQIGTRVIEGGGKAARRYRVSQPSGAWGLTLDEGDAFRRPPGELLVERRRRVEVRDAVADHHSRDRHGFDGVIP